MQSEEIFYITDLRPVTKSKSQIFLNDEFAFVLYRSELLHYKMEIGNRLSLSDYQEIMTEILPKRAKRYMTNLISKRDHSIGEIKEKLSQHGYPDAVIENTISFGLQYKFLDDRRFAEIYIHSYAHKKSRRFLMMDLKKKGVDASIIEEMLNDSAEISDADTVASLLRKKYHYRYRPDRQTKEKLISYLMRKGFSYDQIRKGYHVFAKELEEADFETYK